MIFTWLVLLIQGLICGLFRDRIWFIDNIDHISWLIILFTSIAFLFDIIRINTSTKNVILILLGYFLRIVLLLWDIYCSHIFRLPNSGRDSEMYQEIALQEYQGLIVSRPNMYSRFLAHLYQLFGPQRIIGQYVNILLGVMSVLIALKILRKYKVAKPMQTLALVVGMLIPSYILINSILLRESSIIFLLSVSIYCFVLWLKDNKVTCFILAVVLSLVAATFHSGAIAPALGYAACLAFYDSRQRNFRFNKSTLFLTTICLLVFFIIYNRFEDVIFAKFSGADSISDITNSISEGSGGSGYSIAIKTGNDLVDMVVNTPIRIGYFILAPLPWDWRGINDIIAFVFSALFYGYCYFLSYKALRNSLFPNRELIIALFVMSVISAFVFAWGVKNAGTAMRHRDKFFIQYLLIFALCFKYKSRAISN